ncbi:protein FAM180A [Engraulis encrasicolus]|uniref:protein FAM180A n=1 Tax=Engraulis encrasicolus TaxID=184585 RepID=UPI002FD49E4D
MEVSRLVSMEPVRFLVIAFFSCHLYLSSASHWTKALYPSAYRVKRATPAFINPTFQKSVKDVNLLYEILLSGLHLDDEEEEDGLFAKVDKELASLRCAQTLEVICKDVLPRKLSEIRRLIAELTRRHSSSSSGFGGRPSGSTSSSSGTSSTATATSPLRREDFERTVLTMVYMAQRLAVIPEGHQRDLWAETLLELQRAVRQDLTLS